MALHSLYIHNDLEADYQKLEEPNTLINNLLRKHLGKKPRKKKNE